MSEARKLMLLPAQKVQAEEDAEKKESKENLDGVVHTEDECAKSIRERMKVSISADEKRGEENAKN
jgi:hypothetical protein